MSVDLSTAYLGLNLSSPLVASSSPLTGDIDQLLALQDAGAGAVVLPSLFEETISHEEAEIAGLYEYQTHSYAESLSESHVNRKALAADDPRAQAAGDMTPNLFVPFFTTKTRGTGLGMAIAKRIVDAHGGQIRAANHAGGGAMLEIEIPRDNARKSPAG